MTAMEDPYHLQRFLEAQHSVYYQALNELQQGERRTLWMWFIFPQLAGLGSSATSRYFGISGREEALAYLQHPVLGPRLRECAQAVLAVSGRSAEQIFGYPDVLKLRSCMTLFAAVAEPGSVFAQVLEKYYDGQPDPRTVELLGGKEG